jgi:hypothetical protein
MLIRSLALALLVAAPAAADPSPSASPAPSAAPKLAAQEIPADGKYDKVKVEGVTAPLIHIMESGSVVLVDTDGKKPRTWEVQYKKKADLPRGWFDLRKTDANKNNKFGDDEIDAEGLWKMDAKGNITRE